MSLQTQTLALLLALVPMVMPHLGLVRVQVQGPGVGLIHGGGATVGRDRGHGLRRRHGHMHRATWGASMTGLHGTSSSARSCWAVSPPHGL